MATIREVARKAGVSIGTVSRALNNKAGVSEKRRQHVLAVAQELGYVARRTRPSLPEVTHLGLLIRPTGQALIADPFYGVMFHATEQYCNQLQINLSFGVLDIFNGQFRSLPAMANDDRIGGLILVGAMPIEVVERLQTVMRVPVVLVDNCYPQCAWDSIMTDNLYGAYLATEHMISKGHRSIGMISGPSHPSIVEREAGYTQALQQHGLIPTIVRTPDLTPADGEQGVLELLRQAPQVTAIFCSNDNQAAGALVKLQRLGFKVPDDFSLVGFDGINIIHFTSPPITTIYVDRIAMGQLAAELLLGRILNPERAVIKTIIGVRLIERASVSSPRTHAIAVAG